MCERCFKEVFFNLLGVNFVLKLIRMGTYEFRSGFCGFGFFLVCCLVRKITVSGTICDDNYGMELTKSLIS
jgi:hypothetical protein